MPVPETLRHDASGPIALGALATAIDVVAAGMAMRTIAPDWLATADLEIHAQEPGPAAWAVAEPTLLRAGRTTIVFDVAVRGFRSESEARTQPGRPLAHATMTFVRITRPDATATLAHPEEPAEETRVDFALADSGLRGPLLEHLAVRVVEENEGVVELPRSELTANSFGTLQGGMVATLVQAASETAARSRLGPAAVATDLSVHYLAQGRGPYRTRCEELRTDGDAVLHRVVVVDRETDQTLAAAVATSAVPSEVVPSA
jgi:acyl-coenzyme A thioesterase PaaI-like protein